MQYVQRATHERDNALKKAITSRTSDVIATTVEPKTLLTDHRVIERRLRQSKPECRTRLVQCRKYSAIGVSSFTTILSASDLNVPEQDPEVILTRYDACIRTTIDAHAPVISRITPDETVTYKRNDRREEGITSC